MVLSCTIPSYNSAVKQRGGCLFSNDKQNDDNIADEYNCFEDGILCLYSL